MWKKERGEREAERNIITNKRDVLKTTKEIHKGLYPQYENCMKKRKRGYLIKDQNTDLMC